MKKCLKCFASKSSFLKVSSWAFGISSLIVTTACSPANTSEKTSQSADSIPAKEYTRARVYLTTEKSTDRITKKDSLSFAEDLSPNEHFPTLILDARKTFQTIEGFGGALTDASAETLYKLTPEQQKEIITAYFDQENGIGYSLCRTHINSCDFSSESYAYANVSGDTGLSSFSIEHDRKFRIPLIKEALAATKGQLQLFASPWSPPAWMKTNNDMLYGGKLKPEYMQSWANYYIKFMDEYKKEGITFWGLTVQNEPAAVQIWESCIYTAEDERDFVKTYLGPTLKNSKYADAKLIVWDHNRGIMYQRAKVIYDDPEASKYVWGTGFHWYTGDHFDNVKLHAEAFPDKKLIFTEGCVYPFEFSRITEWHWGETYGLSLINDLNNSTSAWVDWNILLDETGGPNHVKNFCYAPVIADTKKGEIHYMSSFYYLGHFSKFIRPGAKRIVCSSNDDKLLATAFVNTDGTIAVVAMNKFDEEIIFKVWVEGKTIQSALPAHSIATLLLN